MVTETTGLSEQNRKERYGQGTTASKAQSPRREIIGQGKKKKHATPQRLVHAPSEVIFNILRKGNQGEEKRGGRSQAGRSLVKGRVQNHTV